MTKFIRDVLIGVLAVVGFGAAVAQNPTATPAAVISLDAYASPQKLMKLANGRKINILCVGSGSPTVLLEAGGGTSNLIWLLVQPEVARTNRVCSYDRAGMGFSDYTDGPRTAASVVSDLSALLKAANVKGPYVIVGYSLGGIYARAFTDAHRKEVKGMVLVEPSGVDIDRRREMSMPEVVKRNALQASNPRVCVEAAESGALKQPMPPPYLKRCLYSPSPGLPSAVNDAYAAIYQSPAYHRTVLSEIKELAVTRIGSARGVYGPLPLIVLTASNNTGMPVASGEEAAQARRVWSTMHEEMATLSSRGIHRRVPDATHLVVIEKPDVIVAAIAEVVAASKK